MASEWSKSPILTGLALVVIIFTLISFFYRPKSKQNIPREASVFTESVGYVAAEESAKILGEKGGVALILPGAEEKFFKGSFGESYERGFQKAVTKHPSLRLMGHFLGQQPQYNTRFIVLGTLQAVREKFPDAQLLVSFLGLPQLQEAEATQWQSSSPPKMIVVADGTPDPGDLERLFSLGLVQTVLLRKPEPVPPQEKLHGTPQEIVERYYQVLTSSNAAVAP